MPVRGPPRNSMRVAARTITAIKSIAIIPIQVSITQPLKGFRRNSLFVD